MWLEVKVLLKRSESVHVILSRQDQNKLTTKKEVKNNNYFNYTIQNMRKFSMKTPFTLCIV